MACDMISHTCVLILLSSTVCSTQSVSNIRTWRPVYDTNVRFAKDLIQWNIDSLMNCIVGSVYYEQSYNTVRFDKTTNVCYTGIGLKAVGNAGQNNMGVFYTTALNVCDSNQGFNYMYLSDGFADFHYCVFLCNKKVNYSEADKECSSKGGQLFNIYIPSMIRQVFTTVTARVYIGLKRKVISNLTFPSFYWTDGTPLVNGSVEWTLLWAPDQPDGYDDREVCVVMDTNYTLHDVKCDEKHGYVCEIPVM